MFYTETELINAKLTTDGMLNESDIIKLVIDDNNIKEYKLKMIQGEKYYRCQHDILNHDFRQSKISETEIDKEGNEKELISSFKNPNRSNHHNVNPFHKILVDQKVSYIAGREPSICVRGAEENELLGQYEKMLTHFAEEHFNEMIQDMIVGASNYGFQILHIYYDLGGKLQYCVIPAKECIPIYDSQYEKELEQLIRYYDITVVKYGKKITRKKIEWWTKQDVKYFIENDENHFVLDQSYTNNPSPHWWNITLINGFENSQKSHSWGKVPFVILKNNTEGTTDLESIKGLIDAYDMISSEGTNNLIDLVDLYWVIAGYGGETASAIAKKLQINKAVNISDSSGNIEAKQVNLSVEGRLEWLKMLRRDIFQFGQGIDTDTNRFGNAPSGVSIKFQYTLLDLKANSIISKLKKAIKEFFWFVTEDYNRNNNSDFDNGYINITINKSMIVNDKENVEMIQMSKELVSQKTLLANHPFVEDVNSEIEKLYFEK